MRAPDSSLAEEHPRDDEPTSHPHNPSVPASGQLSRAGSRRRLARGNKEIYSHLRTWWFSTLDSRSGRLYSEDSARRAEREDSRRQCGVGIGGFFQMTSWGRGQ